MATPPRDSKPAHPKSATAPVAQDPAPAPDAAPAKDDAPKASSPEVKRPREIGGPTGPEPTRYGDWERNGRVSDF
ncbi:MAG TPA: DUF1674 domain-containing protein [Dongiaceae bacterium]|nr:DUF1674 domain-containing protein [Dongiaceae bacterium]